jgi:lipocalin-like protein
MENIMNRRRILSFAGITAIGLAILPGSAASQQKPLKEQIVGSWTYASNETILPDGSRTQTFGPNQSGLVIFGSDGRYVSLVGRAGIPKFASNSRSSGTVEENKAAVQGSIATFGRYTINEADHSLTLSIEYSSYPNWTGTEQKRPFTLAGDDLKYVVPSSSAGNGRGEVVLRRAK